MVNNFDKIRKLLQFRTDDDFYFVQVLQRKKDHSQTKVNGANNNSRLIKAYYVKSLEHFDFLRPEIVELCEIFGARAGINLNRRSFERMSLQLLRKVTDQIMNKSFNKAYKAYPSVVGAYNDDSDKKWILDIDGKYTLKYLIEIGEYLNGLNPNPGEDKYICTLKSKNGCHMITSPFRLDVFREKYPEIEVHKNNPTNLYIP